MDKSQVIVGASTYVYRVIENKQYLVLEKDPDNLAFTFQEKFDKATGKPFFVSVVTRSKVWELPDISALPPMDPMPQEITSGCTVFKTCHSADGEIMFAPEKLPIELAAGHCWVPQADQIYGKYTFRNAANGRRCVGLPPTYDLCQRIQRMYSLYGIGPVADLTAYLTTHAGEEEAALADLVAKHGDEPKGYLHTKEQIVGVFSKYAPTRMGEVIELLEQHEGPEKEAALLKQLQEQYGEIPLTYRERVATLFDKYAPGKMETLNAVMNTFADREVGLIGALTRKYGPEPDKGLSLEEEEAKERVLAILIKNNVHNINLIFEQGMAEHKSPSVFLSTLLLKYPSEPPKEERDRIFEAYLALSSDPLLVASPSSPLLKPNIYRERLFRFYEKYNPGRLESIDKMLRRYVGSEEQLMAELVKTYGPEPKSEEGAVPPPALLEDTSPRAEAAAFDVSLATGEQSDGVPESVEQATELSPPRPAVSEITVDPKPTEAPNSPGYQPINAASPPPPPPSYYSLTVEELRQRILNIVLVNDAPTFDAVAIMVPSLGTPLVFYEELLATYHRDPTPDQVRDAFEAMERRREAESACLAQAEEEARQAKEVQRQQLSALAAEMESMRVFEAERQRAESDRLLRADGDNQRRLLALGVLAEAEARRKAAELSVETVARASEFAAHDDGDERFTKQTVETVAITASLGSGDTATLIGTLAALEDKLQRAYNQMEASIRKGDAIRNANDELHFEVNELKTHMAEKEKDARVALIEAKNESDRMLNDQHLEKLQMKAAEQATRAEILTSFREEQRKMSDDLLRMSHEKSALNEEVAKQRGDIRELERNIRSLQARLEAKEADELAARAKLKLIEDSIVRPMMDSNFCQTEDTDLYSSQVFTSPRQIHTKAQQANLEELQATVRDLEGQVSAWRLRCSESQTEAVKSRADHEKVLEEYDTSLRVINMLRAKNKQLEVHVKALDLHADPQTPIRPPASPTALSTPRTVISPKPRGNEDIRSPLAADASPSANLELMRRLAASDAESKALRKEIMDLRGLLTLRMSSPKTRR